ncbi:MAG: phosphatidylglycerophosphatase A [Alphaproteobacteria bacterium]|nr:phosphatidylglycerophosphatase A [Alphaproteobacteria bacterium]MDE1986684.1 phosphatidylglycerophosphatase A [Alphaproteobacteria bacterium]MDE2161923.1 phosphatidylglycerophosphatase A [Alphaproteobacteria bacterium]MDE2498987.1 phosphatidylglycerophosphatase A [Alphaproteobacteria bacterium]
MNWNSGLATMFGIGRAPVAPGTAASLVAALAAWPITLFAGHWVLLILGAAVGLASIPIADRYARECGRDDPSECVIDELAGQWLTCAFAPLSLWGFTLAFLAFRLLDMTKPWPVSAAEKLAGGVGIVADDIVAGLIAGAIVALFWWFGLV